MILVPAFGRGPNPRSGLLGLVLALAGILLAATIPGGPRDTWFDASAAALASAPTGAATALADPIPTTVDPGPTIPIPAAAPHPLPAIEAPGPGVPPVLAIEASGPQLSGRAPTNDDHAAQPPRPRKRPPAAEPELASPRTPGAPPEATFHRLIDTVTPGVHRCMRSHAPPLARLELSLQVGGPRHNGVAMDLGEHQGDAALLRCLAPLVSRLRFPASEQVARYTHVFKP